MSFLILPLILCCSIAEAVEIKVAVAANFLIPLQAITKEYESISKDKIIITSGSSGKFFAQIKNGAPFDIFFSADQTYPKKLIYLKLADVQSSFTYATGALVLWSADPKLVDSHANVLKKNQFKHIAIANPELAPYGKAAVEALKKLNVYDELKPKFVMGESINQAHQFISTGNAELGFVALSTVKEQINGSQWLVPQELYSPIHQDAVMISSSKNKIASQTFIDFMKEKKTKIMIEKFGYTITN